MKPRSIIKLRALRPHRLKIFGIALILAALTSIFVSAQGPTNFPYLGETGALDNIQPINHPVFPFLDSEGNNVLDNDNPVSTMKTCGACHNSDYIATHSFHASAGLDTFGAPGSIPGGHTWDTSTGLFGKWNPITYRYLSNAADARTDLSTAEWIQTFGARHIGGGPATTAPYGTPLINLTDSTWNWSESGVVEMNCFLCHLPTPNNDARIASLESGNFKWANTATLLGSGMVNANGDTYTWNKDAFDAEGNLLPAYVANHEFGPSNDNCGQCHGEVYGDISTIVTLKQDLPWNTATTGEIVAPQRLDNSGINLVDKENLTRAFDVHAERAVACIDCHPSTNNPIYFNGNKDNQLSHLIFDGRRMDIANYLGNPSHDFEAGLVAQSSLPANVSNTMRQCDDCHDPYAVHDWLPYKESHFESLSCESCHIPHMYAPAYQQVDWTIISTDGNPQKVYRGVDGTQLDENTLVAGFTPALLPKDNGDNSTSIAPHNMISAWYWVYDDPERPVPVQDLKDAYLDGDNYRSNIISAFDADGNGVLSSSELRVDTQAKEDLVKKNLEALGINNPRIAAEVDPYSISHDVTNGDWATKECTDCHSKDSQLGASTYLASYSPGGVSPDVFNDPAITEGGDVVVQDDGSVLYKPDLAKQGLYVFGYSNIKWIDWLGILAFLGALGGITIHGGLRYYFSSKNPPTNHEHKPVYMYDLYERLWHWLQAAAIFILVFTGLIIHKPQMFGIFSFPYMVQVHNLIGLLLAANAAFALLYNLASGEIKQYVPQPRGYFNQMFTQGMFYAQGIFKGDPHPFEKTKDKKLNPLQQFTYIGLLNVLLPLQVISGVTIWSMQIMPQFADKLGGLPVLAPIHSLIAWLLATFIVVHIYLTTTGDKVLGGIEAMVTGWEQVEVPHSEQHHNADSTDLNKNIEEA